LTETNAPIPDTFRSQQFPAATICDPCVEAERLQFRLVIVRFSRSTIDFCGAV